MIGRNLGALALALSFVAATPALADNIPLFNTGVDGSGNVLANGAVDTHYSIVGVGAPRAATSANGYPIGPWLGDNTTSRWVGPNTDGALDGDVRNYDYRVTFSLADLNAATASISGMWSTDDAGVDILINGVSTGQTAGGFQSWYNFSINSGFVAGVNTLDFIVYNSGGPTGLRVEMTGTADAAGAVPEPASWALMLGGFGLVGGAMRSRRTQTAVSFG